MSCKCKCKGATSSKGDKGNPGTDGEDGLFGGYSSSWLFDDGLSSNPGAGDLRLNAADPTAATEIYVNTTNSEAIVIAAFLASFSNGGVFGWIRLFDEFDSAIFSYYKVTAVAVTGSVYTLTVTYVDGSGVTPFVNNTKLVLSFVPRGEVGSITSQYATSSVQFSVPQTVMANIAGIQLTAPSNGTYIIIFEGTYFTPGQNGGAIYKFQKNGSTSLPSGQRALFIPNVVEPTTIDLTMNVQDRVALLAGDTIDVGIYSTGGTTDKVTGRSLLMIKV